MRGQPRRLKLYPGGPNEPEHCNKQRTGSDDSRGDGLQQQQLEKVAIEEPNVAPEEVLKKSRRQQQINLRVVIGENLHKALNQFTLNEGTDQNNAVITLLEAALSERGYL